MSVDVPYEFTNDARRPVCVVNCNGLAPPGLEKRVEGEWVRAWGADVPSCLSDPIIIHGGSTFADTLRVVGAHPANPNRASFHVAELAGLYRLVWENVLWTYDAESYPFGESLSLPARTSNAFTLTGP